MIPPKDGTLFLGSRLILNYVLLDKGKIMLKNILMAASKRILAILFFTACATFPNLNYFLKFQPPHWISWLVFQVLITILIISAAVGFMYRNEN